MSGDFPLVALMNTTSILHRVEVLLKKVEAVASSFAQMLWVPTILPCVAYCVRRRSNVQRLNTCGLPAPVSICCEWSTFPAIST